MARRPHADLIHAYAEGAEIEFLTDVGWMPTNPPEWHSDTQYRIKPKEPEWYENIPEHGVLCWVSVNNENPDENSAIAIVTHKSSVFCTHRSSRWNYATPLTNDEIRQFLRGEQ